MSPKKGKVLPGRNDRENGPAAYAMAIAAALRTEFRNSRRAVKVVMGWTGVAERTAKHWLAGQNGPSGWHLIALLRESEMVFEAVLLASGRANALAAARVLAVHGTVVEGLATLERLRADPVYASNLAFIPPGNDQNHDRQSDRANDRHRTDFVGVLNARQRWYVEALAAGIDVRASQLSGRWDVSDKTARRDIAQLRDLGIVEFVGSSKAGRYRLVRR